MNVNREEVTATLKILKVAYPAFYSRMTRDTALDTIEIWCEMFRNDDAPVVKLALHKIISEHTGYPPTIADIKQTVNEMLCHATGKPTDERLWQLLKDAVSNGYYEYREEYEKLPEELKRYLGSAIVLRELSQMDTGTFNTVYHGQFLKQIQAIRERVRFDLETPPEIKNLLASTANSHKMQSNGLLTEEAFNDSRNRILNQLE